MFDAIVFASTDLGFVARAARKEDDAGQMRLTKIGHLDPRHNLPKFNMPLELGLFPGSKQSPLHSFGLILR